MGLKSARWKKLSPLVKVELGVVAFLAVAGALYLVVTLVLIGLGNLGIGDSCVPSCGAP